jgi:hypothetical protein
MRVAVMAALAVAAAGVAGCAVSPTSYVSTSALSAEGSAVLASDIVGFVGTEIQPANGSIAVQVANDDARVGPALLQALQQTGYSLTTGPARHHLAYTVTTLPDGTVLRVTLDQITAGRLYHSTAGYLDPAGPFSVIDAGGGA